MMTGRDDFANELLSAYLDGELSSDQREQVAHRLAADAEYRSELEALQALQAALQELPRFRLAPEANDRIMQDIRRLAAEEISHGVGEASRTVPENRTESRREQRRATAEVGQPGSSRPIDDPASHGAGVTQPCPSRMACGLRLAHAIG